MSKHNRQDKPESEDKKPGLIERAAGAIGGALGITNNDPQLDIYDVVDASLRGKPERDARAAADAEKAEAERLDADFRKARYWPEDKPLPKEIVQQGVLPCPECRRTRLDDLSQAVVCTSAPPKQKVKYFRCKDCGHQWKLPVKKV